MPIYKKMGIILNLWRVALAWVCARGGGCMRIGFLRITASGVRETFLKIILRVYSALATT